MSYIGTPPTQQAFTPAVDFFNGNGSTTAFTLSRPVASVAQVQAVISNVPQKPGDAYTVSGNTITFTSAPPSGTSNIYVYYTSPITQVIAPGQGTVGTDQIQNGAVIPADLSTGGPYWNSSGNLGVGTSSPGAKLSLTSTGNTTADGVRLTFGSEARAHNIYSALATGRDLTIAPWRALTINTGSGTTEGVLTLNAYEYTVFGTGSSYTERMRLDASGNLGIATASPDSAYKLTIQRTAGGSGNILLQGDNTTVGLPSIVYKNTNGGATAYLGFNGENITAKGIAFPATQSASSDANTLDDYEEGTWLPNIAGNATYSDRVATYTKVGRMVTCNFDFTIGTIGTGSTNTISGFPFANTAGAPVSGVISYYAGIATALNFIAFYVNNSVSTAYLVGNTTTATTVGFNAGNIFQNGTRIIGSVTFPAS